MEEKSVTSEGHNEKSQIRKSHEDGGDLKEAHSYFDHDYGLRKSNQGVKLNPNKPEFFLLGSPLREFIDPISSPEQESDWIFQCACQNPDDSGDMICCDKCNSWQHIACVGLSNENLPLKYFCDSCFLKNKIDMQPKITEHTSIPETPLITIEADTNQNGVVEEANLMQPKENPQDNSSIDSEVSSKKAMMVDYVEEDGSPTTDQNCDCVSKLIGIIMKEGLNNDYSLYDGHAKNKNCHSFTLKNGQKILKSSKMLENQKFICEIKGDLHILGNCSVINKTYNAFSSFMFTFSLADNLDIAIDARASNHFSRYIRRSCTPNTKLTCAVDMENVKNIKVFLYSLENVDKHQEITIGIDRSKTLFTKYPSRSIKHHWQKYDYSSSLICQCGANKTPMDDTSSTGGARDVTDKGPKCSIYDTKVLLKSNKASHKKSNISYEQERSSSPTGTKRTLSESSSDDEKPDGTGTQDKSQGLTREQKKMNYWLKIINQMEDKHKKKNNLNKKKRSRKSNEEDTTTHSSNKERMENGIVNANENITNIDENIPERISPFDTQEKNEPSTEETVQGTNKSWYIPQKLSDLVLNHSEKILKHIDMTDNERTEYRRFHIPIRLALKRGLYHLISSPIRSTENDQVKKDVFTSYNRRRFDTVRQKRESFMNNNNNGSTQVKTISSEHLTDPSPSKLKKENPPNENQVYLTLNPTEIPPQLYPPKESTS